MAGIVRPTDRHGPRGGPDRRHDPLGARAVTRRDESLLDPPYEGLWLQVSALLVDLGVLSGQSPP